MTSNPDSVFATVNQLLQGTGLFVRGGFHPEKEDRVPSLPDDRAAKSVVLVGNAGNALWEAFSASKEGIFGANPLDNWVDDHLERVGGLVGASVVFPTRRPWPPIQQWAAKSEAVHKSPINIFIHPEYGLWHVYRGALLFPEHLELPPAEESISPCDSCETQPCLSVCPAHAFTVHPESEGTAFDPVACVDHVESVSGKNCTGRGCLARRACPVGKPYRYQDAAGAFHMSAVVKTVRRWQERNTDL